MSCDDATRGRGSIRYDEVGGRVTGPADMFVSDTLRLQFTTVRDMGVSMVRVDAVDARTGDVLSFPENVKINKVSPLGAREVVEPTRGGHTFLSCSHRYLVHVDGNVLYKLQQSTQHEVTYTEHAALLRARAAVAEARARVETLDAAAMAAAAALVALNALKFENTCDRGWVPL
jgi:hypothetical protein